MAEEVMFAWLKKNNYGGLSRIPREWPCIDQLYYLIMFF